MFAICGPSIKVTFLMAMFSHLRSAFRILNLAVRKVDLTKYCSLKRITNLKVGPFIYSEQIPGTCYLFSCGPPDDFRCQFTSHGNYTSAVLSKSQPGRLEEEIRFNQHETELTRLRFVFSFIVLTTTNFHVKSFSFLTLSSQRGFTRKNWRNPQAFILVRKRLSKMYKKIY